MANAVENDSYRALIKKAYIEPIKSVLAIDDEYQSLDRMLEALAAEKVMQANSELDRQIKTLKMARDNKWIADMHDGQSDSDPAIYERLNQCDLLLLDYHLDAQNHGDPSQALKILSELNKNSHFNLVVIYTRENLKTVRREVFTKLSSPNELVYFDQDVASKLVDEITDSEDFDFDDLVESISIQSLTEYLMKIQHSQDIAEIEAFLMDYQAVLPGVSHEQQKLIFHFAAQSSIAMFRERGEFTGDFRVLVSAEAASSVWIKTNKLFIAVVSKKDVEPASIKDALLHAIEDWNPTCHRLLLSKIKHELDDNGQSFEDELLSCGYTNAGWLQQFVRNPDGAELTVSRLMDGLTQSLKQSEVLNSYSQDLKTYISENGLANIISRESKNCPDIGTPKGEININKNLNAYISTKKVEGANLMTGHVIKWKNGDKSPELLLCLTPACDLVPGRTKNKGRITELFPYLPIITIRLLKENNEKKALESITKKPLVVLKIDGKTEIFNTIAETGKPVFHEQVFAGAQGRIFKNADMQLVTIHRTILEPEKEAETDKPADIEPEEIGKDKVKNLINVSQDCEIVAQLRYEYALNLLQRLGQDLSRIGLDFVQFS